MPLILYVKDNCKYSKAALDALKKYEIKADIRNIVHNKWAIELIESGGKYQVPCLFDMSKNICIYESDAIIDYLHNHVSKQAHHKHRAHHSSYTD